MKRLGVAAIISSRGHHSSHVLLGRRGKDPNRGLYVLPGGGVEDGESLEAALQREVLEETGLKLVWDPYRWDWGVDVVELSDRIILITRGEVELGPEEDGTNDLPKEGGDLYNVGWYASHELPWDMSPVVAPVLVRWGFTIRKKPE